DGGQAYSRPTAVDGGTGPRGRGGDECIGVSAKLRPAPGDGGPGLGGRGGNDCVPASVKLRPTPGDGGPGLGGRGGNCAVLEVEAVRSAAIRCRMLLPRASCIRPATVSPTARAIVSATLLSPLKR